MRERVIERMGEGRGEIVRREGDRKIYVYIEPHQEGGDWVKQGRQREREGGMEG